MLGVPNVKNSHEHPWLVNGHNPSAHGTYIKHAISGEQTTFVTGTKSELNMFRVIDCTGKRGEPVKCYYSNPEQFERTRNIQVDTKTKNAWLTRIITKTDILTNEN